MFVKKDNKMKKIMAMILVISASAVSFGFGRGEQACSCNELERRISGLRYVLSYARLDHREAQNISSEVDYGMRQLSNSRYQSVDQQESTCSIGNQGVDRSWVRWQPWVARQGADHDYGCR